MAFLLPARRPLARRASVWLSTVLAAAPPTLAADLVRVPGPSSVVHAIESIGSTAYIGGDFSEIGLFCGGGVAVDATTGRAHPGNPGFHPPITPSLDPTSVGESIADGAGGWFLGGEFGSLGGVARPYLAHVDANGNLLPWTPPAPDGAVSSLVVSGNTLFVGGRFTALGGTARSRLAAVDATTGALLEWNPGANAEVHTLAVSDGTLYVGGSFSTLGGQPRSLLGALDAATGAVSNWDPNVVGSRVSSIALAPGVAYIGGTFGSVHGVARTNAAAVDLATGTATPWAPNPSWTVHCLLVNGSSIFAAGMFSSIGGQSRMGVALLDDSTGLASATWNAASDRFVSELALSGTTLYMAGEFSTLGGQPRNHVGAVDVATALATPWAPALNSYKAWSVATSGAGVYLGGPFTLADCVNRRGLAAIDLATRKVTSWNPNVEGPVRALVTDGNTLWVGGGFTVAGGLVRRGLAAYAPPSDTPTAFDAHLNEVPGDIPPDVDALALGHGKLYIGGKIDHVGTQARRYAGAVDPVSGAVTAWSPQPDLWVREFVPTASHVYLGGSFASVGGAPRVFLAQVDTATGMATSWTPPPFTEAQGVRTLVERSGVLYVGGTFQSVGGQPRRDFVAVDPAGAVLPWTVGAPYGPAGTLDLDAEGPTVLAAGGGLRVLDPTSGADDPWTPPNLPLALAVDRAGDYILVGGWFKDAGTVPSPHLAAFLDPLLVSVPNTEPSSLLSLARPSPNPARLTSNIAWRLTRATAVSVSLVDLAGRKVRSIVARAQLAAGPHARTLDVAGLAPGLYLLAVEAGNERRSQKLLIVR